MVPKGIQAIIADEQIFSGAKVVSYFRVAISLNLQPVCEHPGNCSRRADRRALGSAST